MCSRRMQTVDQDSNTTDHTDSSNGVAGSRSACRRDKADEFSKSVLTPAAGCYTGRRCQEVPGTSSHSNSGERMSALVKSNDYTLHVALVSFAWGLEMPYRHICTVSDSLLQLAACTPCESAMGTARHRFNRLRASENKRLNTRRTGSMTR